MWELDDNDNPEDDVTPNEKSDIPHAMRHWQRNTEQECMDVPLNTSFCDTQDVVHYQGKDFCGWLINTEGVF